MDNFDDIFGSSSPSTAMATTPINTACGDDELDALFGIATPDAAVESAVLEAMEADRHAGINLGAASSIKASPSSLGHKPDDSFSDIFGDSPTNVNSEILSQLNSHNSFVDDLLANLDSSPKTETASKGTTKHSLAVFSLSDDDDEEDVTEFIAPAEQFYQNVYDQRSPAPSPKNSDNTNHNSSYDVIATDNDHNRKAVDQQLVEKTMLVAKTIDSSPPPPLVLPRPKPKPRRTTQEPIGEATKTNARALVTKRTRRASSSSSAFRFHTAPMSTEEVQATILNIKKLVTNKRGGKKERETTTTTITEQVREEVRSLCLRLLTSEKYYELHENSDSREDQGFNVLKYDLKERGRVWSMMLGVDQSNDDQDHALENAIVSCVGLKQKDDMRNECRSAAQWATTTTTSGTVVGGVGVGVGVESLATDMELLLTFWSTKRSKVEHDTKGDSLVNWDVEYSLKSAWLAAPFYSSGLGHTTTIYKCMCAMEGAIVPGMQRIDRGGGSNSGSNTGSGSGSGSGRGSESRSDQLRDKYVDDWRSMAIVMFQLLLKYHDPTLAAHLGMDIKTKGTGGVTSYLIPHHWLHGGFLIDCTTATASSFSSSCSPSSPSSSLFSATPSSPSSSSSSSSSASSTSQNVLSRELLAKIWDIMVVDSNPMFTWYIVVWMLIQFRARLMSLPSCLNGIISQQRTNTNQMSVEITRIFHELFFETKINIGTILLGAFRIQRITPFSYQTTVIQHLTVDDVGILGGKRPSFMEEWYHRLLDFYIVHNKEKIMNLPDLLLQFQGKEYKLVSKIEQKYAPKRIHGSWRQRASACVGVGANEIVPHLLGMHEKRNDNKVKYFFIDCRSASENKCGKFGSAFWIDPVKMAQGNEDVHNKMLESLEALRGQKHICVMGSGRNRLLECISLEESLRHIVSGKYMKYSC